LAAILDAIGIVDAVATWPRRPRAQLDYPRL
jgi:hypothetical protein